jgi:hypothetical protein
MKFGRVFFRILMLIKFLTLFKVLTLGYFTLVFQLEKDLKLLNLNHSLQLVLRSPAPKEENYF